MRYTDATGKMKRASTETENKQLAQAALDKVKAEVWEQKKLGVKEKRTLDEAAAIWLKAKENRRTIEKYRYQIEWWCKQFKGKYLHEITQDLIVRTIAKRRMEEGNSPSTMNRYLAALRGCLRLVALKYQWINRSQLPSFFMEEEPKGRTRWLKPDEVQRLLKELPTHWQDIAGFAFATGQRIGNVLGLRWDQVDLKRKVVIFEGEVMKNGDDHGIGLSDTAVAIVQKQIGKHLTHVFTYRGKPLKQGSYETWHAAMERAGIEDFRRHDMRHTWASMMAQSNVSDGMLMALGSWKTAKMVKRYAHHNAEALRPYAQVIDDKLGGAIASVTQKAHREEKSPPAHPLVAVR